MKIKTLNTLKEMTVGSITENLSLLEKIAFHFTNYFGKRETYRLRINGPDFKEVSILWGAYRRTDGKSVTVAINCTSSAFHVLQRNMSKVQLLEN